MHFTYPATIKDDGEGNFLVTFRDIPFAATEGKTVDEALTEAQDCLETAIASCVKDKQDIPTPSKLKKGDYPIRLPAQTAAKTALYIAIKKSGLSNSELARRLGTDEKEIRRMVDPWHPTKLPRIEMALSVLGFHLSVSMESAA
ncbi:type II toxin-antitoxin system HicB family antitoxin [Desulfobacter sp.]